MDSIWNTANIRQAREDVQMLVKEAAEALNIVPEYLSMLENGHRQPSQKLISNMSRLYLKPVTFFLNNLETEKIISI